DHLTAPVEVAAVLPLLARIEQQWGHQRRLGRGDDARLTLLLREAIVVLVEEIVAHAGRVQQQHAGGDVALGRAQLWLPMRVEALDHPQLADLGDVGLGRRVAVEPALTGRTFVDGSLAVGEHRDDARNPRIGGHDTVQDRVGRRLEVLCHCISSLIFLTNVRPLPRVCGIAGAMRQTSVRIVDGSPPVSASHSLRSSAPRHRRTSADRPRRRRSKTAGAAAYPPRSNPYTKSWSWSRALRGDLFVVLDPLILRLFRRLAGLHVVVVTSSRWSRPPIRAARAR